MKCCPLSFSKAFDILYSNSLGITRNYTPQVLIARDILHLLSTQVPMLPLVSWKPDSSYIAFRFKKYTCMHTQFMYVHIYAHMIQYC